MKRLQSIMLAGLVALTAASAVVAGFLHSAANSARMGAIEARLATLEKGSGLGTRDSPTAPARTPPSPESAVPSPPPAATVEVQEGAPKP